MQRVARLGPAILRFIGDEGRKITFHFCPSCGATVYYVMDDQQDVVAIPVGAFADSAFPAPVRSVYETRRHAWVGCRRAWSAWAEARSYAFRNAAS